MSASTFMPDNTPSGPQRTLSCVNLRAVSFDVDAAPDDPTDPYWLAVLTESDE